MLNGTLAPDSIGNNPTVIGEIQRWLLQQDDEVPFLLLPVRIETRFVRAERPIERALNSGELEVGLQRLEQALRALAERELSAEHGRVKKVAHAVVEGHLSEVEARAAALQQGLDEVANGDAKQVRSITKLVRAVAASAERAKQNLGNLKSEYKRAELIERWQALDARHLQPLFASINERVLPRLKFRTRFSTVTAADVLAQLAVAKDTLGQLNRKAPTGPWRERRPHPGTAPADAARVLEDLARLSGIMAHAVRAGADERRALAEAWSSLDAEIAVWIERLEDESVRARASEARRAIAALDSARSARWRVVRTKDLDRSAVAYADMLNELRRLLQVMREPTGRDAFEQSLSALADYRKSTAGLEAQARQLVAIPAQSQELLEATLARVRKLAEAQLVTLGRAADNRPFRKDELKIVAERTRRSTGALGASIAAVSGTGRPLATGAPLVFVSPTATAVRPELWVRIFPDDVAVQTHEAALTPGEVEDGRLFWREFVAAGSDENLKRAAWAALCAHYRPHRAAWIARRLEAELSGNEGPAHDVALISASKAIALVRKMLTELAQRSRPTIVYVSQWSVRTASVLHRATDSFRQAARVGRARARALGEQLDVIQSQLSAQRERLAAELGADRRQIAAAFEPLVAESAACSKALSSLPTRPDAEMAGDVLPPEPLSGAALAEDAWTDAAHVRLLPKRFVVVAIRGGKALHVVAGKQVPAKVTVGIGPGGAGEGAESFSLSENGDLVVDPRMRWMTNYDTAVEQGLAVTIPLTAADAAQGFDRLLVVGVRETGAATDRRLLEELLEGHRYTPVGLELLPLGTPTNNTESAVSGHSPADGRDAGARYELEFGEARYAPEQQIAAGEAEQTDGFRLATALGIEPGAFARVRHAEGRQISDAIVVNRLLWPATMGHYLEEMLAPIVSVQGKRHVQEYFSNDVLARGSQSSIRIGAQPYAVLPTMAFRSFRSHRKWKFPPAAHAKAHADAVLAAVLERLEKDWLKLARTRVKRADNWDQADSKQHFLDMMAVHPTASELHWRYAMNSAPHIPLSSDVRNDPGAEALLKVTYHHLLDRFRFLLERAYVTLEDPAGNPLDAVRRWEKISLLAKAAPAYDMRYLARESPLSGATHPGALALSVGELGSIVDSLLQANPHTLVADSHRSPEHPSLLALLLRHSVLCAYREAALDIWGIDGRLSDAQRLGSGSSSMFSVPSLAANGGSYLTKWSYLLCKPPELARLAGGGFSTGSDLTRDLGTRTLAQDLAGFVPAASVDRPRFKPALRRLAAYEADLRRLKQVNDIDRLLREHLDLCSYRLDAWRTALATRRLREQRKRSAARGVRAPGVHVGAYGWLEDLKPDGETPAYAAAVPEGLTHLGEDPVYTDPSAHGGLIYAPSVNHAVTAAVLRSGYLSSAEKPDLDSERAVNLSSKRVRTARWLLTGIRNGNSLGALLGYRLERALHEAYDLATGVELDRYVFKLRREFPTLAAMDAEATTAADRQRQVIDGLALLERVRSHVTVSASSPTLYDALRAGNYQGFPWGLENEAGELLIPEKRAAPALAAFAAALDDIADALDAVGDLLLAEGVYQVARGNLERASAVTTSMAEGSVPPEPQIVDTPRTGTRVTQRVVLATRPLDGRLLSRVEVPDRATRVGNQDAARPVGWTSERLTPRACLEPTLNAWLATFLGPSTEIAAYLVDQRDSFVSPVHVRVSALGLQPLDLVCLLGSGMDTGLARLAEQAIAWAIRSRAIARSDAQHWRAVTDERHPTWSASVCSFRDAAISCEALHRLLTTSRTATAADFDLIEQRDAAAATRDAPDLDELSTRITECVSQLTDYVQAIATLVGAAHDPTQLELDGLGEAATTFLADEASVLAAQSQIEATLLASTQFGIDVYLPEPTLAAHEAHVALADQLRAVYRAGMERVRASDSALAASTSVSDLQQCARQLFGGQATVAPCFRLGNVNTLRTQLEAPAAARLTRALGPDALDDWLHGVSKVRERMAALERVLLLNDAFDRPAPALSPAQLPYVVDDYWLGATFPPSHQPSGDKLSLVFLEDPKAFDPTDDFRIGLVLDEWDETIPASTETTGVTFHYDAPDAAPPQCLLLVVTPVESGKWLWEDLVHALDETLDLAQVRMVEPDHLQDEFYGHLLPALSTEVLPSGVKNNDGDRPSLNLALAGTGQGGP